MRRREIVLEASIMLIFIFLFGVLGSAAETSAFSASQSAHPSRFQTLSVAQGAGNRLHIIQALHNVEEEAIPRDQEASELSKRWRSRQIVPTVGLATLTVVALAAKGGALGPYTDGMIARDAGAALLTGTLGYIFVKGNTWLAEIGYLDPRDSRKIIHTFSAPLFILFWPLFSPADGARYFAASVGFVNAVRLYIAGSGGDKSLAYAVSRTGNQNEALGGPFFYVVILLVSILLFWRDGPVGIVALSAMAAGDGLADLVGRRYGQGNKWWFNTDKSIAGTVAFWIGATLCATALLNILSVELTSPLQPDNPEVILGAILLITALLEAIPGKFDDNWVVPLSAAALSIVAFS